MLRAVLHFVLTAAGGAAASAACLLIAAAVYAETHRAPDQP
jgi:hypothetical protein